MIISLAILLVGYLLMSGGGSENPHIFNDAIFSFRRITLAPFVILVGYFFMLYAILKRPEKSTGKGVSEN